MTEPTVVLANLDRVLRGGDPTDVVNGVRGVPGRPPASRDSVARPLSELCIQYGLDKLRHEEHQLKAARLVEIAQPLVIEDVPLPEPGPREAVVKVAVEGICRTDWHTWMGDWSWVGLAPPLPITMGHEFAGEVTEVGSEVTGVQVGDRVAVPVSRGLRDVSLLPGGPDEPVRRDGVSGDDPRRRLRAVRARRQR